MESTGDYTKDTEILEGLNRTRFAAVTKAVIDENKSFELQQFLLPVVLDSVLGVIRVARDAKAIGAGAESDAAAQLAKAAKTAEELRNSPGIATVSGELKPALTGWLDATKPAPIPAQIADRLKGRTFKDFAEFRSAFWTEVAADPELSKGFTKVNQGEMSAGNAPFAPRAFQSHDGANGMRFNLHHDNPIEKGGPVYDMSNIYVVSPLVHDTIHGK